MRVLVTIDLSEAHDTFCARARPVLDRLGATVDVLYAGRAPALPHVHGELMGVVDAARGQLQSAWEDQLVEALALLAPPERRGVPIVTFDKPAAEAIVERVVGRDLVLVGTHGRQGMARAWIGSVAERVVRTCPIPVLVLHGTLPPPEKPLAMLVSVDLASPHPLADAAGVWADHFRAVADALYVHRKMPLVDTEDLPLGQTWSGTVKETLEENKRELAKRTSSWQAAVRGEMRAEIGEPADTILAEAHKYGLVAVSTHGRTGLTRMWMGSVAERVARMSPVPVLVVPPKH